MTERKQNKERQKERKKEKGNERKKTRGEERKKKGTGIRKKMERDRLILWKQKKANPNLLQR